MERIDHFSHDHPLVLKEIQKSRHRERICQGCKLPISTSFAYFCDNNKCYDFYIHISCTEFPREMRQHPFHPQHTLTLTLFSEPPEGLGTFDCHVCGSKREGFSFHCSVCDEFDMDLHCAVLKPKKGSNNNYKITHPHPLIICDYKNTNFNAAIKCTCCQQPIVKGRGPIFVCLECRVLLDESCVRLPRKIRHPFHSSHSLTLLNKSRSTSSSPVDKCHACGHDILGFSYQCSRECDFELDVLCATSLIPITTNNDKSNIEDNEHIGITSTTHPHPLITCRKTHNSFPLSCSMCLRPFEEEVEEDCIYVCLDCKKLLHKLCACLPGELLKHPYHPEHPLSLVRYPIDDFILSCYSCKACRRDWPGFQGFVYVCPGCRFILHTRCALPVAPLINTQLHLQHPLALVEIKEPYIYCKSCRQEIWDCPFFRCVECDFNLHVHCLSKLPLTVKHTCHLHLLTLTNLPIKDCEVEDDDSEFLCDACEKERRLYDPTYYCAECHFVAHVHCVISEILPSLQGESSSLADNTLHKEIATLKEGLKKLKEQQGSLRMQIENRTIRLEELKDRRAKAEYKLSNSELKG